MVGHGFLLLISELVYLDEPERAVFRFANVDEVFGHVKPLYARLSLKVKLLHLLFDRLGQLSELFLTRKLLGGLITVDALQ